MVAIPGYSVPLPYTNGGGESLVEVLDSLQKFQTVCDTLFANITERVGTERERYDGLAGRISECAERVEALKGRRQAIVVQSSPKFPVLAEEATRQPCVHLTDKKLTAFKKPKPRAVRPITYIPSGGNGDEEGGEGGQVDPKYLNAVRLDGRAEDVRPLRPVDPCELFEFGLLMPQEATLKYTVSAEKGLGKLPRKLPSVSSLLLFNTRENPYKEYSDVNLFSQSRVERVIAARRRLGAAGNIHEDFTTKASADEYGFVLEMEDAPDLFGEFGEDDLGLDNVAILDWQGHEVEDGESIAPSAKRRGGDGDTELPSVSEMAGIRPSKPLPAPKLLAIGAPPGASSPTSGGPPPPPPPPSGGGFSKAPPPPPGAKVMGGPSGLPPPPPPPPPMMGKGLPPPAPPSGLPPPPPPPPPMMGKGLPPPAPPSGKMPPPPPPPAPPGGGGAPGGLPEPQSGRGALMEAIRSADPRSLLKKVGNDTSNQKKNMNSFAAQLANRRKGIEGRFSDDEEDEPAAKPKPKAAPPAPAPVAPPPKAAPPPPPPPKAAPGGKLGGRRQFAEEEDDWG